jgi:hypothetical protein
MPWWDFQLSCWTLTPARKLVLTGTHRTPCGMRGSRGTKEGQRSIQHPGSICTSSCFRIVSKAWCIVLLVHRWVLLFHETLCRLHAQVCCAVSFICIEESVHEVSGGHCLQKIGEQKEQAAGTCRVQGRRSTYLGRVTSWEVPHKAPLIIMVHLVAW